MVQVEIQVQVQAKVQVRSTSTGEGSSADPLHALTDLEAEDALEGRALHTHRDDGLGLLRKTGGRLHACGLCQTVCTFDFQREVEQTNQNSDR